MRTTLLCFVLGSLLVGANFLLAQDFVFKATVHADFVLLTWSERPRVDGFNIYRKTPGGTYAKINPSLIAPMTDCSQIETLIPRGSVESTAIWNTLKINPCSMNDPPTKRQQSWFQARSALALRHYKIAEVRGVAYEDHSVTSGQTYLYMVRGVTAGIEEILQTDLEVTAGAVVPLPSPTGVQAEAGDMRVFVRWNSLADAMAYHVQRSTSSTGPYIVLTPPSGVAGAFKFNPLTADTIAPPTPGFLDTTCVNNVTYYYEVQGIDIMNRPGTASAAVSATPRDKTPPETPKGIIVQPLTRGLKLTWARVDTDIVRRPEQVQGYRLYRYDKFGDAAKDTLGTFAGLVPQPGPTVKNVNFTDSLPTIQPETTYWYRIQTEDMAIPTHNFSAKSASVSGFYKDPFPPGPPTALGTDAYEDSIMLHWSAPTDLDLAGFYIYRGICGCETVYVFQNRKQAAAQLGIVELRENRAPGEGWALIRTYCRAYDLSLIANIDSAAARYYADRSVPKGSPICYRYAMKAYDKSQNLSAMSDSVCDRLKDRTGPTSPVIAGLKARDRAVLVQWVSPPIQDLYGFIVERAPAPGGPWIQVTPTLSVPDPSTIHCGTIPATNNWADSIFAFLDSKNIKPKTNYWYRVKGVDYTGNVGDASPEIGTYTYDRHSPEQPSNLKSTDSAGCVVVLSWDPVFDAGHLGFVVFRSKKIDTGYIQISPLIRGNAFKDEHVAPGTTYYYKVQYFAKDGNRSEPSTPKSHTVPK